jgi:hypothetical protein
VLLADIPPPRRQERKEKLKNLAFFASLRLRVAELAKQYLTGRLPESVVVNEMMHSFSHRKGAKRAKIYTIS